MLNLRALDKTIKTLMVASKNKILLNKYYTSDSSYIIPDSFIPPYEEKQGEPLEQKRARFV